MFPRTGALGAPARARPHRRPSARRIVPSLLVRRHGSRARDPAPPAPLDRRPRVRRSPRLAGPPRRGRSPSGFSPETPPFAAGARSRETAAPRLRSAGSSLEPVATRWHWRHSPRRDRRTGEDRLPSSRPDRPDRFRAATPKAYDTHSTDTRGDAPWSNPSVCGGSRRVAISASCRPEPGEDGEDRRPGHHVGTRWGSLLDRPCLPASPHAGTKPAGVCAIPCPGMPASKANGRTPAATRRRHGSLLSQISAPCLDIRTHRRRTPRDGAQRIRQETRIPTSAASAAIAGM